MLPTLNLIFSVPYLVLSSPRLEMSNFVLCIDFNVFVLWVSPTNSWMKMVSSHPKPPYSFFLRYLYIDQSTSSDKISFGNFTRNFYFEPWLVVETAFRTWIWFFFVRLQSRSLLRRSKSTRKHSCLIVVCCCRSMVSSLDCKRIEKWLHSRMSVTIWAHAFLCKP